MLNVFAATAAALLAATALAPPQTPPAADATERTRSATIAGENGRTHTVTAARARGRETRTAAGDRTRTVNDAATRSVEESRHRTGDNTFTRSRVVTNRRGETRSAAGDFTVQRADGVQTVTGPVQNDAAGQMDVARQTTRTDDGHPRNSRAVLADGRVVTRAVDVSRTQTGATRLAQSTGANGATRSVEVERVRTGQGEADVTRTMTAPNGQTRTTTGSVVVHPQNPQVQILPPPAFGPASASSAGWAIFVAP